MLAEARKLIERHGWSNVQLLQQDATQLQVDRDLDGVLFSLSYSVMPEPRPALARAWEQLRPSSRVVVMDLGLPDNLLGRVLGPIRPPPRQARPGRSLLRPLERSFHLRSIATERFLLGLFYVSAVTKP